MTLPKSWHYPQSVPRLLLDDEYAPITSEIGFIELGEPDVVQAYVEWQERIGHMPESELFASLTGREGLTVETHYGPDAPPEPPLLDPEVHAVEVSEVRGDLARALQTLLPLREIGHDKVLLAPTASAWTAYFDNGWGGTDAFPPMSFLAEELGCRALRVVAVPHDGRRFAASALEVYGAKQTEWLNVERALSAMNDGGTWRYSELGQPLPFERGERHRARRIRDRFPLALLADYCAELGLRVFDESFYNPDGRASIVHFRPRFDRGRTYSLEEARAEAAVPSASALPPTA